MADKEAVHSFPVKPSIAARAHVDADRYRAMYEQAAGDPDTFWAREAKRVDWIKAPTKIKNTSFTGSVPIKWFEDGVLNASATCLDKHLAARGDQVAIIWEGDDPGVSEKITYRDLHQRVCRLGNAMRKLGVSKGDRVTIYLPMVPEAAIAMLACARIGAIHSVVFGGFSPDSLANRIQDCGSTLLITADEGRRGGRKVALKTNADEGAEDLPDHQGRDRRAGHRRRRADAGGARQAVCRAGRRRASCGLHARADGCGGSAVHPVHVG